MNAIINKGKDFTLHEVEVNAISEPGSYVAFAAMPNEMYSRGMNDGLSENNVSCSVVISCKKQTRNVPKFYNPINIRISQNKYTSNFFVFMFCGHFDLPQCN